jgi:hypothetical protein
MVGAVLRMAIYENNPLDCRSNRQCSAEMCAAVIRISTSVAADPMVVTCGRRSWISCAWCLSNETVASSRSYVPALCSMGAVSVRACSFNDSLPSDAGTYQPRAEGSMQPHSQRRADSDELGNRRRSAVLTVFHSKRYVFANDSIVRCATPTDRPCRTAGNDTVRSMPIGPCPAQPVEAQR